MLPTVVLFSSVIIDTADFHQFLAQLGVDVQLGAPHDDGHWFRGDQSLLISLHPDWSKEYGDKDPMIGKVRALLEAEPQTCVVVDFTRSAESGLFAVEFANEVNRRWPIVAIDESQMIYDGTAIAHLLAQGRGFSLTTTGEPLR